MKPASIIDPVASKYVRRLERRARFREALYDLIDLTYSLAEYEPYVGYVYPEMQSDIEAAFTGASLYDHKFLVTCYRILASEPCSTPGRIRDLVDALLLVTELNTDDVSEETRTVMEELQTLNRIP